MWTQEYEEGYEAGTEFHLGSGYRAENPYHEGTAENLDWDEGFDQAGQDS